ncbi:MAG: class I SAM-dependent methyltransferase [Firmicutes bacterium]|nr:class I SAM-dependent methyltransferase [Bacillota bacterium]
MDIFDTSAEIFKNPIKLAHHLVTTVLRPGDTAVDATAGNGHDTLFLCRVVGGEGSVYAFDSQPLAIGRTADRIKEEHLGTRVYLINDGHENMGKYIEPGVRAVMFNLGYLPGSGHRFNTQPASTIAALDQAKGLLAAGGIITVVVYTGHPGAVEEKEAVESWAAALPQEEWTVINCSFPNWRNHPPQVMAITRRKSNPRRGEPDAA